MNNRERKVQELHNLLRQLDMEALKDFDRQLAFMLWKQGDHPEAITEDTFWDLLRGAWSYYTLPVRLFLSKIDDSTKQFAAVTCAIVAAYSLLFFAIHRGLP